MTKYPILNRIFGPKKKINESSSYENLSRNDKIQRTKEDRCDFELRLKMYRAYKAYLFYRENIGKVEIKNNDGELIPITFPFPSFYPLLTQ